MSDVSFRKGQWAVVGDEILSMPAHDSICVVLQREPDWDSNARLIAAAPDLLECVTEAEYALGNAVKPDCWRDFDDLKVWAEHWLPGAREALVRARPVPLTPRERIGAMREKADLYQKMSDALRADAAHDEYELDHGSLARAKSSSPA